jgi:hypothetical protein
LSDMYISTKRQIETPIEMLFLYKSCAKITLTV